MEVELSCSVWLDRRTKLTVAFRNFENATNEHILSIGGTQFISQVLREAYHENYLSSRKEIQVVLYNPNAHYRVYKTTALVSILSHKNPIFSHSPERQNPIFSILLLTIYTNVIPHKPFPG